MTTSPLKNAGYAKQVFEPFSNGSVDPALATCLRDLSVEPVSAMEWHLVPRFEEGPRMPPDHYIYYFKQAQGHVTMHPSGERFPVGAGDMLLLKPGALHTLTLPTRTESVGIAVHFNAFVLGGLHLFDVIDLATVVPATSIPDPRPLFDRLCREYAHRLPGFRHAMAAIITSILFSLIRELPVTLWTPAEPSRRTQLCKIVPALRLMEVRLHDATLTAADLARACHLSESRLRQLFGQLLDLSPMRYAQRRRVERAAARLRATDHAIEQIAYDYGFCDNAHFYRAFRQWMHMTPGQYRKTAGHVP